MQRNSTTLFLTSPGATTALPWVNNAPDFSSFTEPTLSVLQQSWTEFIASGESLEVIPDPEPVVIPTQPNWDGFNGYMVTDPMFRSYRNTARTADGDANSMLLDGYSLVATNGVGAFTLTWNYWCQLSGLTTEDREIIANVAQSFDLPTDFVAVVRGQ